MDKINILLIEDTKSEEEALTSVLLENDYNIVGVATNYTEALTLFYQHKVDLVIIDVFLNGQPEGITFAETITITPNVAKPFVFLTSSKDRQIFERAKLTKPFSFLLKPFNELEILYAIEMAIEKFYDQTNVFLSEEQDTVIGNSHLFIKKKNALKKVALQDIIYIEVEERYCNIITSNENYLVALSLTKITEFLDTNTFAKTHRNYIVNTNKINEIILSENLIILEGNYKVTLSEKYKDFIHKYKILK
ncbi:response regulator transcription factor [Flavobacterium sp. F372]|jgi:two-component system LytT family response regulator|uniref:Response regulator transcription factor n=1 Tax=Flavobacterium bernardetii TaxID=2813823 RepID=A0ABR7J1G1_9FLAO|nr:response regulator transcription factor [Flavobacterium bernardetii]MBC5835875.1 response regulator transcription factor [Flavobacterium bernardetii]NHF69605.1 response regulator transcription factor [Flavobacterium bernardetii]